MSDERPAEGRERLLAAAVRHLETHGEAELRVTEIAEGADVAIGLILNHFRSRDGLVAAAQQRRIEGVTREDLAGMRSLLTEVADNEALMARVAELTRTVNDRRHRDRARPPRGARGHRSGARGPARRPVRHDLDPKDPDAGQLTDVIVTAVRTIISPPG